VSRKPWIEDKFNPSLRTWEKSADDRLHCDRVVETTHAIDCGGGCTMRVGVRRGRVVFERPKETEFQGRPVVRACAAGLCAADAITDPGRVRTPLVRRGLLDAWIAARRRNDDPIRAWETMVAESAAGPGWRTSRGQGGFVGTDWDTVLDLVAAAVIHTVERDSPSRILGMTSPGAHALVTSASGRRFLRLIGARVLSSLHGGTGECPGAAAAWGDAVDTCDTGTWAEAAVIVVMGFNPCATMAPDAPLLAEARLRGTRIWVVDDVHSTTGRYADHRIPVSPAGAAGFWSAVTHCVLKAHFQDPIEGLDDYLARYTDAPLLVRLLAGGEHWRPDTPLCADATKDWRDLENARSKFLLWNGGTDCIEPAPGAEAYRKSSLRGRWNLRLLNPETLNDQKPTLSLRDRGEALPVRFHDPLTGEAWTGRVPSGRLGGSDGSTVPFATIFDLLSTAYGVRRDFDGELPDEPNAPRPFSPAWTERASGVDQDLIRRFADEWIDALRFREGRCLVLSGWEAGLDPAAERTFSALTNLLILSGCVGRPGGGLAYYSGQRKIHLLDSWGLVAGAEDWLSVPGTRDVGAHISTRLASGPPAPRLVFVWDGNPGIDTAATNGPFAERTRTNPDEGSEWYGRPATLPAVPELVVDLNFRVDGTALRSDIILPAATGYEKADLNCAETTNRIHAVIPVLPAPAPTLSEWEIFGRLSDRVSEMAARFHDPERAGLEAAESGSQSTDSPGPPKPESTQDPRPNLSELSRRYRTLGPHARLYEGSPEGSADSNGAPGRGKREAPSRRRASTLDRPEEVCETLLACSSATNGFLAAAGLEALSASSGLELALLGEDDRRRRVTWDDLRLRPAEPLTSSLWSGRTVHGSYVPFRQNIEFLLPWRTATGRQRLGWEALARPSSAGEFRDDMRVNPTGSDNDRGGECLTLYARLRFPKWSYRDLFSDLDLLQNLFRPGEYAWISPRDAHRLRLADHDFVELESEGGSWRLRCAVSRIVPEGTCLLSPNLGVSVAVSRRRNEPMRDLADVPMVRLKRPSSSEET
jgi:nitrate reductase alpha subunit